MKTITLKISEEIKKLIIKTYEKESIDTTSPYMVFKAKRNDFSVDIYKNAKGAYKAVFSGDNPLLEARRFDETCEYNEAKEKVTYEYLSLKPQIGSDEVGVGDFVLPVIVVAAYLDETSLNKALNLGIKDSKKLTDKDIRRIGEELVKFVPYSKLTVHQEKYNEVILNGENLNSVKAKMHNSALLNLKHKYNVPCYIDEFCSKDKYYSYLDKNKEILYDLVFYTKGESRFPSIAVASIIARYSFLLEKDYLENKYNMEFPFGSGVAADKFAKEFVAKYGLEEFKKIAKKHFKNYSKLLEIS